MDNIRETIRQLMIIMSKLNRTYSTRSSNLGCQSSELWLLYALDDGEPHSQKQLCDEWGWVKTTLNSVTKKCEAAGYLTLMSIPGKKREMQICLTESGRAYAKQLLKSFYQAEAKAMEETLKLYPAEFVDAIKCYNKCLNEEFNRGDSNE